jgi:hypothetical protein
MLELVLMIGLSAGGGEVASEWVTAYESAERDEALRAWWAWRNNQVYGVPSGSRTNDRVQFAPIFVNRAMEWAVPNSVLSGANAYPLPPLAAFPEFPPGGSIPPDREK